MSWLLPLTVALPFTYLFIPPFAKAVYTGEQIGPTYTGMPPMRPASNTVKVDGLEVDRDTLEIRAAPRQTEQETYRRSGPQGPSDVGSDLTLGYYQRRRGNYVVNWGNSKYGQALEPEGLAPFSHIRMFSLSGCLSRSSRP